VKEGELDAFPVAATIPRVANYHWRNWHVLPPLLQEARTYLDGTATHSCRAGTFEARPKFLYKPTTTKEIIAVLAVCFIPPSTSAQSVWRLW